jgi:hypothetical protein
VSVPVAEQQVQQSGGEKPARVDLLLRALTAPAEQCIRPDDATEAAEADGALRTLFRSLLDVTDQAGVLEPEISERRVVGQHDQHRVQRGQSYGLFQAVGHHSAERVGRADLILHQIFDQGSLQLGGDREGGDLVGRTQHVLASVRSHEPQGTRLLAGLRGSEPPGKRADVEDSHLDRAGPQVPVSAPQQEAVQGARAIARPERALDRSHEGGFRCGHLRRARAGDRQPELEEPPGASWRRSTLSHLHTSSWEERLSKVCADFETTRRVGSGD